LTSYTLEGDHAMSTIAPTDERMLEPLLREVHATEQAALPPMTTTDRIALRAARSLLAWSRHHREHVVEAAALEAMRDELASRHPFEHRMDSGSAR
jgi:hypothetical protein